MPVGYGLPDKRVSSDGNPILSRDQFHVDHVIKFTALLSFGISSQPSNFSD